MEHSFRVGRTTISKIVNETCSILWNQLQPLEMSPPTQDEWIEISKNFFQKTQFPNCLGAIDGKHIRIIRPEHCGSQFYNYKQYNSIVLMAVADSNYRFISIDVGAYGKEGDSSVFRNSVFGQLLYNKQLNIPNPVEIAPNINLPFVFVADEAFGLHTNLLRPYPKAGLNNSRRVFNYRLSRARRYVECAFGILSNKWRVFHTPIHLNPDFATNITKAGCILHNFIRVRDGYTFQDTLSCDLEDYNITRTGCTLNGRDVREQFKDYFMSPVGRIPWQDKFMNVN